MEEAHSSEPEPEEPEPQPEEPSGEHTPTADEAFEVVHGYKPSESPEEMAKMILQENLIPSVNTLVHLAVYAESDRIRLEAARYVIERNLGKLTDRLPLGDMWEQLFKEIRS